MLKRPGKILLLSLAFFLFTSVVGADNAKSVSYSKVNPGDFLYPFKRVAEKSYLSLAKVTHSEVSYHNSLAQGRLKELSYVVNKSQLDQIQTSSQRYQAEVGVLADLMVKQKYKSSDFTRVIDGHKKILSVLRDKNSANSSYWMLVQHAIDTLDLNSAKFHD